ncbi:zinc-binding dehydrogenase [Podospora fimiseda]|uniref:Zinc-binding dehydrogenase n=1 Tax=Podospora fimiseda TaxID=252190 RepID=A0AAN6YNU4_9PEZI|nr:zinc-binding dehydrogenase [Podospora fimiseda]
MKAIVVTSPGKATLVTDRPIPPLRPDYLLVKTVCVALNPTDWKHAELTQTPGVLLGCDYSGTVEAIGSAVTKSFSVGDGVFGFVHGGNSLESDDGAFAEYILVKADIQAKIPQGMGFEEAATFGVGITSVGQGLYQTLGLPLPGIEAGKGGRGKSILIYGGSTCTGSLGIQFARLSGVEKIVSTASPHNFELAERYGATEVYDYGEGEDAAEEIREATGDEMVVGWDTISTPWTVGFCAGAMKSTGGGKLATLHPVLPPRSGNLKVENTLAYTVFGEDWGMGEKRYPAKEEDFEFGKRFWGIAEKLIREGKVKPVKIELGKEGLKGVLEGLQLLRDSKVSGRKLVYRVAETP